MRYLASFLLRQGPPYSPLYMFAPFLFFLLAVTAIAAAVGMLLSRNPVYSALWLILNLFCVAGLYLTLNAAFIGVVQVLVYAGAIMVLFLFVIMLLNLEELPRIEHFDSRRTLAFVAGLCLMAVMTYALAAGLSVLPAVEIGPEAALNGTAGVLSLELFTIYALPFEMVGILLLVATIGAVMIAKRNFA